MASPWLQQASSLVVGHRLSSLDKLPGGTWDLSETRYPTCVPCIAG